MSIATLYRHFPTRESLLLAISHEDALEHASRATDLLRSSSPVAALRQWLREMGRYGLSRPGMASAFRSAAVAGRTGDEVYQITTDALGLLLERAIEDGSIRADYTADDLLLALCGLWELEDSPEATAQCDRLSGLLVDGLRVGR